MDKYEMEQSKRVSSRSLDVAPEPMEPNLIARAHEILRFVNELECLQHEIRLKLTGPYPSVADGNSADRKRLDEPCLEELLAMACTRIACLVGDQKSILGKI